MHRRPVAGRHVTRRVALVAVLLLAGTALSACREDPEVAGYLGTEVITPAQVDEIYNDAVTKYQAQAKLEQDNAAEQAKAAGQPAPTPSPIPARPKTPTRAEVLATILIGTVCTRLQAKEGFAITLIPPDALGQNEHLVNSRYLQERAKTLACLSSRIGDAALVDPTDAELLDAYNRAVADGIALDPFAAIKEDLRADESLRRTIAVKREIENISAASDIVINPRYRPAEFPVSVLNSGVPVIAAVIGESDSGVVRDAQLMPRIVLLVTSPRMPAGLLTAEAWDLVRAHPVLTALESETAAALRITGADVTVVSPDAQVLIDAVRVQSTVVWLAGPAGDETLARELGLRLAREPGLAELELMYGSWDPPGARLLDAVTVMDRLASPGGDPWKHQQTHQTLARYLLEESYEAYDAMQAGDLDALREELGDVLLQVLLHARMAEGAEEPWSVDDVAGGLTEKLIRRNPHVFSDATPNGVEEITANWERIKREEKDRGSVLDGISLSQPALALAAQVLSRARRAGLTVPIPADEPLFAQVEAALARGVDAEAELRKAVLAYAKAVRAAEEG